MIKAPVGSVIQGINYTTFYQDHDVRIPIFFATRIQWNVTRGEMITAPNLYTSQNPPIFSTWQGVLGRLFTGKSPNHLPLDLPQVASYDVVPCLSNPTYPTTPSSLVMSNLWSLAAAHRGMQVEDMGRWKPKRDGRYLCMKTYVFLSLHRILIDTYLGYVCICQIALYIHYMYMWSFKKEFHPKNYHGNPPKDAENYRLKKKHHQEVFHHVGCQQKMLHVSLHMCM